MASLSELILGQCAAHYSKMLNLLLCFICCCSRQLRLNNCSYSGVIRPHYHQSAILSTMIMIDSCWNILVLSFFFLASLSSATGQKVSFHSMISLNSSGKNQKSVADPHRWTERPMTIHCDGARCIKGAKQSSIIASVETPVISQDLL